MKPKLLMPKLLMIVPAKWAGLSVAPDAPVETVVEGEDDYNPQEISYALGFRPRPGLLKTLPNLKAIFSLGAGVDGFLSDPEFPKQVPLIRFVDRSLAAEMAQYVLMHVLIAHRTQRYFDEAQRQGVWRQRMLPRRTAETRVGFLGMGEIGAFVAPFLVKLGFPVSCWTRARKDLAGVESFAGEGELAAFLSQTDILVCLLSLTRQTAGILNAKAFAAMPKDGFVINVARGAHLIERDLLAALDRGHLAGAVLDVFDDEPLPAMSPLWRHPKVTVTPHVAAISQSEIVMDYIMAAITKIERGETPDNVVDVERAY
jgi:glyoxylate/hydroxypyruvate reductase